MGIDLLSGKITPDEAYKTFRENVPPLGSGLGATREEAFEEVEGVLVRGWIIARPASSRSSSCWRIARCSSRRISI